MNNHIVLKKFMSYALITIVFFISFGVGINFYLSQAPIDHPNEMCWKGKYIVKIDEEGSVYTRTKGLSCEIEGDIIILEFEDE